MKTLKYIVENKFLVKKNITNNNYVNPIDEHFSSDPIDWDTPNSNDADKVLEWLYVNGLTSFKKPTVSGSKSEIWCGRKGYIYGFTFKRNSGTVEQYYALLKKDRVFGLSISNDTILQDNEVAAKIAKKLGMIQNKKDPEEYLAPGAITLVKNGKQII